jgi:nicotinate-nucleotide adenylyltransferase
LERIGLFGGTFNPIHRGHLHAADEVEKKFPLNRIYLIPSALPPHKRPDNLAEAADRLEMIRLAIAGIPYLKVSEVELSRSGPSYTIDTVTHYQTLFPSETELYLIMGIDAFLEIDTWKSFLDLLRQISFIIMSRPHEHSKNDYADKTIFTDYLYRTISKEYEFSSSNSCYHHPENRPIFMIDVDPLDISSTEIRNRIQQGRSIRPLVSKAVANFIKAKGLYL